MSIVVFFLLSFQRNKIHTHRVILNVSDFKITSYNYISGGFGYNGGYNGGYDGFGGFGGYGSSNANALGGGSAQFGNVGTNNVAYTNTNPWGSNGFASNNGYGSGYGVNIFGAANSQSNYGQGFGFGRR